MPIHNKMTSFYDYFLVDYYICSTSLLSNSPHTWVDIYTKVKYLHKKVNSSGQIENAKSDCGLLTGSPGKGTSHIGL